MPWSGPSRTPCGDSEGSSADIVEAAGKAGSSSLYKDLKTACDEDIAICILGQY
jgi:hypothetical protein